MTLLGIDRLSDTTQVKLWDERDLSTSSRRREQLEILLCQKVQKGEDPALCEQVLNYLYFSLYEQNLHRIAVQKEKDKSVFATVQQVFITSFAILGMFAFFAAAGNKSIVQLPTMERSSSPAIERQAP
ncbi:MULTISPECIES: hypothetical protein [Nostoc]|uniref:Uncharacterized protein n=1 Tax=Nostoc paludosum FACHB-159 TaxID=2692908 RepID=A0ABR8KJC9_9NOSO|nr:MULTISPECIES: hypothetical protein [Nostoc]MBD2683440.1 hypothetical protein [Nostoc sp. FACHB-857]MBD2739678.1 hypothetical protein [Nostoc paludosum FACHB-159]